MIATRAYFQQTAVGAAARKPPAEQLLRAFRTASLHSRSPAD